MLRKISLLLWKLAAWTANAAAYFEVKALGIKRPEPGPRGYDFMGESFWWDITQNERFQPAIKTLCSAEEAKLVAYCRELVGRKDYEGAARAEAAATMVHDFPLICNVYAELWSKKDARAGMDATRQASA